MAHWRNSVDGDILVKQIAYLRQQGMSIRAIATELGVSKSRVERTLNRLAQTEESPASAVALSELAVPPFVGRRPEIESLQTALGFAMSGRGQMAMLAGEPGIGKTRISRELTDVAERQGVQTLWGWCYEGEGAPPFWPWIQAIRAHIDDADAATLDAEMGGGVADIATLLPEIRDKLPELTLLPVLEPEQARFRLFDSIATFLKNASAINPLLIVLEDLHWADRSSLLLWEFVSKAIRDSRVMLVGAYRNVEIGRRHPLSQTLGALIREPNFHRIQLSGLDQDEAGQLFQLSGGVTLARSELEAVHSRTEGNPLFLNELVRLVGQEGSASWTSTLPQGMRDVIGRRLDQLTDECNEVLTVASIIGREFAFGQLDPLVEGLVGDRLWEALDEAASNRIIESVPETLGRYRFTHAVIQEVLADELSMNRRVRLHARIAQVLEELYGSDSDAHSAELARHYGQAVPFLDTGKLAYYSRVAGNQALAAHAYEDALDHFQRALDVGSGQEEDSETAEILFGLGSAQVASLQREEARDNLKRSFSIYVNLDEINNALAIVESLPPGMGFLGMSQLTANALELVSEGSLQAGWLLARHANEIAHEQGEFDLAIEFLQKAIEIARREEDRRLEMRALVGVASVYGWESDLTLALDYSLNAIRLASECDSPYDEALAHHWATVSLFTIGDPREASAHARAALDVAQKLGHRWMQANVLDMSHAIARSTGNWEDAFELGTRGLEAVPNDPRILSDLAITAYDLGDFERGDSYLDCILQAMRNPTSPSLDFLLPYCATTVAIRAWITGEERHIEIAENVAQEIISSDRMARESVLAAWTGRALIAVMRGDEKSAEECYASVSLMRGRVRQVQGDHILALLARTMHRPDDARVHFEDALAFCRKGGLRPLLAWSLYEYSQMLLHRENEDDWEKALTLLTESSEISDELGMLPLRQMTLDLQNYAEDSRAPVSAFPDNLTEREVEVLSLVSSGMTNRGIAEALFINPSTVERHISNIFNKTGSANRADATRYAMRHGLAS